MAARGRMMRGGRGGTAFGRQVEESSANEVHPSILKQARRSGNLNISGRSLETVPDSVWRINIDVPEEAKTAAIDCGEDRWWEQVDLTKMIAASNCLKTLSEDISNLPALTVLDVHDNKLESLPDALGGLENLQKLDISRNNFVELPSCIGRLKTLVSLHVENNKLSKCNDNIGDIHTLEDLDISNNQLTRLPKTIGYLTRLIKFNISNNQISYLPPEIACMDNLKYFEATHNQITSLPWEFGNLKHIELLYLRHNKLVDIPVLENCESLKELHLGNNAISELSAEHLKHLSTISVLDIRDNKISVLPDEITVLKGLERLDITNNNLTGLPFALGTIESLKSIVLDGNPMKSIRRDIIMRGTVGLKKYLVSRMEEPAPIQKSKSSGGGGGHGVTNGTFGSGDGLKSHDMYQQKTLDYSNKKTDDLPLDVCEEALKAGVKIVNLNQNVFSALPDGLNILSENLTELKLGINKFSTLSSDIGRFSHLNFLDLRNNLLSDLPTEIGSLQNLREIILSYNRFSVLPSIVCELTKLEILFLDNNKLDTIDVNSLKKLPVLATLDLQNNNISQVPPELGNCTTLQSLQLRGNAIRNPRPAILDKGTPAILEYLRGRIIS